MNPWKQLNELPAVDVLVDVGVGNSTNFLYDAFTDADLILVDPLNNVTDINREYTFLPYAAGNKNETATFYIDNDSINKCTLYDRTALTKGKNISKINVEKRTLDSIVILEEKAYGLKIDAEGAELEVLQGATNLLDKCSWVICETSVLERFVDSYTFEDVIMFMQAHGFRVKCVLSAFPDEIGRIKFLNLGFTKNDNA